MKMSVGKEGDCGRIVGGGGGGELEDGRMGVGGIFLEGESGGYLVVLWIFL